MRFPAPLVLALGLGFSLAMVAARGSATVATPAALDEDCLTCHGDPDLKKADGTSLFDQEGQGHEPRPSGPPASTATRPQGGRGLPHAEKPGRSLRRLS
jgi:hypothetical protein